LRGAGQWIRANPRVAAELLAPIWGLDADTVELANSRRSYEVRSIGAASLSEQQSIADAFLAQGVLPHKVNIGDIGIWKP